MRTLHVRQRERCEVLSFRPLLEEDHGIVFRQVWDSGSINHLWCRKTKTVSNALLKSINTPTENYFLSIEFERLSIKSKTAIKVE